MSDIELEPGEARGQSAFREAALIWLRPVWAVLHDATAGLFRHDGIMVASAIAFSLTFALFPFAIFIVALGALVGGQELAAYVSSEALTVLPANVIKALEPELNRMFAHVDQTKPLTFGILVTLVSITGAIEAIRDGLNRAYGCAEDRHLVRRYFSSLFFVFVGVVFLLIASALGIAVPIAIGIVDRYLPGPEFQIGWLETGREAVLALVTLAMLFAFHLFLPAQRTRIKGVVGGVLFTLIVWWLAGKIFGLYITEIANFSATYAGLAGLVILMFFLYIQAVIFLYGAELNRSIADLRGNAVHKENAWTAAPREPREPKA